MVRPRSVAHQTDSPADGSAPRGPVVVYFAKAPRPGEVKTRLSPPLTPEEAAALYRAFLAEVVRPVTGATVLVYGWPADALEEIRGLVGEVEVRPQEGPDLFTRMENCFAELFAEGFGPVMIRNTDSPDLPMARVEEGLAASATGKVVFGPDFGGGYYLVSLSEERPDLFRGLPEGQDSVYAKSLQVAKDLGLEIVELARERDVDTYDDLIAMWRARSPGD